MPNRSRVAVHYCWNAKDRRVFDDWRKSTEWGRLFDRCADGPVMAMPAPPPVVAHA